MGKKKFLLKNPMIFKEFREFFYMQLSEFKNSMHFKSYMQKTVSKTPKSQKSRYFAKVKDYFRM